MTKQRQMERQDFELEENIHLKNIFNRWTLDGEPIPKRMILDQFLYN